jgi:hypothetical protein
VCYLLLYTSVVLFVRFPALRHFVRSTAVAWARLTRFSEGNRTRNQLYFKHLPQYHVKIMNFIVK